MWTAIERVFELSDIPKPRVTVAMPVFNGGKHLFQAVQSIVLQSHEDWELLVLDDGSTDSALAEINALIVDNRVKIISDGQNKGIASRLNQAATMAKGEFFARMDHDDISHPNRLLLQLDFLEKNTHVDLVSTDCITIDNGQNIVGYLSAPETHSHICKRPWLSIPLAHPTWMGRTSWFLKNPYSEPGPFRCEDNDLLLRTYRNSVFQNLAIPLLAYRVSSQRKLRQTLKTRLALMSVQISFFSRKLEFVFCFLSVCATLIRLFRDLTYSNYLFSNSKILRSLKSVRMSQQNYFSQWNEILRDYEPKRRI